MAGMENGAAFIEPRPLPCRACLGSGTPIRAQDDDHGVCRYCNGDGTSRSRKDPPRAAVAELQDLGWSVAFTRSADGMFEGYAEHQHEAPVRVRGPKASALALHLWLVIVHGRARRQGGAR